MKSLFLVPPTMNVETIVRSYFSSGLSGERRFLGGELGDFDGFDYVFYVGAINGQYSIEPETLRNINKSHKVVFLFIECGNPGWDDLLKHYISNGVVTLMVGLGGDHNGWLHRDYDLTLLGCVDPLPFIKKEKDILIGACYGPHPAREKYIEALGSLVTKFPHRTESYGHYGRYADFISSCDYFLHLNFTDDGAPPTSGNFKMLEAAYGNAIFLEKKGSQISRWFTPGEHYLEYNNPEDIKELIGKNNMKISTRMRAHVLQNYSNKIFWEKIINRLKEL